MDGTSRRTRNDGGAITKPLAKADDFWKFCLQHHNKPEVQKACMALQENYKGNVNIALMLAWVEFGDFSLSNSSVLALEHCIKKTEPLLRRYRLLRRDIKDQLTKGAYQKVLNFELGLEKIQQQDLIECLNTQTWHPYTNKPLQNYFKNLHPDAISLYPDIISRLTPAPKKTKNEQIDKAPKTKETSAPPPNTKKGIPLAISDLPSTLLASTSLEDIKQLNNPLKTIDTTDTPQQNEASTKNKAKQQKDDKKHQSPDETKLKTEKKSEQKDKASQQVDMNKNLPFVSLTNEKSLESNN